MIILLHVHSLGGPQYEAIGPFADEAAVARFLANPAVGGDRGWIKVEVQAPEEVIEYFQSRY